MNDVKSVIEFIRTNNDGQCDFSELAIMMIEDELEIHLSEDEVNTLKSKMFHCKNGNYALIDSIVPNATLAEVEHNATHSLEENGCFEVDEILKQYRGTINKHVIENPGDLESLLISFSNIDCIFVGWHGRIFGKNRPLLIRDYLQKMAKKFEDHVEKHTDRIITSSDLQTMFPYFSIDLLNEIVGSFCERIIPVPADDSTKYILREYLNLPDSFSDIVNNAIIKLEKAELPVSAYNLKIAISIEMSCNIEKEYSLQDQNLFKKIISKCYTGTPERRWNRNDFSEE